MIVSSTIVLSFSNTDKKQLNEICLQLKTDIRYVQKMSMAQNKEYAILFDEIGKKYSILTKKGTSYKQLNMVYLPSKISIIEINDDTSMIIFTKTGTVKNGSKISIQTKKYRVEITVLPSTGRVDIKEIIKK